MGETRYIFEDKIRSANELTVIDFSQKISALTGIPKEGVEAVFDSMSMLLVDEFRKKWDATTEDTVQLCIPKVADLDLRFTCTERRFQVTVYYIKWDPTFYYRLEQSIRNEDSYLAERVMKSCGDMIIDKFLKIIYEDDE